MIDHANISHNQRVTHTITTVQLRLSLKIRISCLIAEKKVEKMPGASHTSKNKCCFVTFGFKCSSSTCFITIFSFQIFSDAFYFFWLLVQCVHHFLLFVSSSFCAHTHMPRYNWRVCVCLLWNASGICTSRLCVNIKKKRVQSVSARITSCA